MNTRSLSLLQRMGSTYIKLSFIAVILLVSSGFFWAGTALWRTYKYTPPLVVSEEDLNFGEAWEQRSFPWILPISNRSGEDIEITQFASSCSCVAFKPNKLLVPSGETVTVQVLLDLTPKVKEDVALTNRHFSAEISPLLANGKSYRGITWTVHGHVQRILTLSGQSVDFHDTLDRYDAFEPKNIKISSHIPLRSITVEPDNPLLSARVYRSSETESSWELSILPSNELPVGRFNYNIHVLPIGVDGTALPEVLVPVKGIVVDDVRASPSGLVLGAGVIGQVLTRNVLVKSTRGLPFKIDKIDISSPDMLARRAGDTPDGGIILEVSQRISKPGDQSNVLTAVVSNSKRQATSLSIPVSYYGFKD